MQGTKHCSSCKNTKPAGDFIHPRTGKDGATCAECIIKRSAAAKRTAPVDTAATLQLHTTRLDDHEGRIACVEDAVFEDAPLGAPAAPDAGTFTKSQLRRQRRRNKKAGRAAQVDAATPFVRVELRIARAALMRAGERTLVCCDSLSASSSASSRALDCAAGMMSAEHPQRAAATSFADVRLEKVGAHRGKGTFLEMRDSS